MGCLFVLFGALVPRFAVFLIWLARPALISVAFDTWIIPLLGFMFLPFTTLLYILMYDPVTGIEGLDYLWLGLAVVLDIGHLTATAADRKYRSGWRTDVPEI
jgi:hypothetical protein